MLSSAQHDAWEAIVAADRWPLPDAHDCATAALYRALERERLIVWRPLVWTGAGWYRREDRYLWDVDADEWDRAGQPCS